MINHGIWGHSIIARIREIHEEHPRKNVGFWGRNRFHLWDCTNPLNGDYCSPLLKSLGTSWFDRVQPFLGLEKRRCLVSPLFGQTQSAKDNCWSSLLHERAKLVESNSVPEWRSSAFPKFGFLNTSFVFMEVPSRKWWEGMIRCWIWDIEGKGAKTTFFRKGTWPWAFAYVWAWQQKSKMIQVYTSFEIELGAQQIRWGSLGKHGRSDCCEAVKAELPTTKSAVVISSFHVFCGDALCDPVHESGAAASGSGNRWNIRCRGAQTP